MAIAGRMNPGAMMNNLARTFNNIPGVAAVPAAGLLAGGASVLGNAMTGGMDPETGKPGERILAEAIGAGAAGALGAGALRLAGKNVKGLAKQAKRNLRADLNEMDPNNFGSVKAMINAVRDMPDYNNTKGGIRMLGGLGNSLSIAAPMGAVVAGGLGGVAGGGLANLVGVDQSTNSIPPSMKIHESNSDNNLMNYYAATASMGQPVT